MIIFLVRPQDDVRGSVYVSSQNEKGSKILADIYQNWETFCGMSYAAFLGTEIYV